MSVKFLLKYAELHDICLHEGTHIRLRTAYLRIFGKVPKSCCGTALVNTPVGVCGSVVIATNKNSKELKRADDLEMIHKVQLAMGISEPPKWYVPEDEWCVFHYSLCHQSIRFSLSFPPLCHQIVVLNLFVVKVNGIMYFCIHALKLSLCCCRFCEQTGQVRTIPSIFFPPSLRDSLCYSLCRLSSQDPACLLGYL
jgi:hypothetical protein